MEISKVVVRLSALAQESRLAIFRLLVEAGPRGMTAGEIGAELGIPPPTLSFHLKDLSHAELVHSKRSGRTIIYSANYSSINEVINYLKQNCCGRPRR